MSHRLVNPEGMPPALGFSHAVVASGTTIHVAGQIAADPSGAVIGSTFEEQFETALGNVAMAVTAAGGLPEHIVSMHIFTTAMHEYRRARSAIGPIYRERMGRHFPAMAVVGVSQLYEPEAIVEITAIAVLPDRL